MNKYGYFAEKGYKIIERETPRHWYNYMYNDDYITFTSQVGFGQGFAQDSIGRRITVVDDRAIYITDVSNGRVYWNRSGISSERKGFFS